MQLPSLDCGQGTAANTFIIKKHRGGEMPEEPSQSQRRETLLSASLLKDGTSGSTVSISTMPGY